MDDSTKKTLMAVGVGVGATGVIATAMYFLGGREAPKTPSLGELGAFGKREMGFGAIARTRVIPGDDECVETNESGLTFDQWRITAGQSDNIHAREAWMRGEDPDHHLQARLQLIG